MKVSSFKKLRHLIFFGFCVFFFSCQVAFAATEIVRVISFEWDQAKKKLIPMSVGSGTTIAKSLILTNAHVVQNQNQQRADFILLCPSSFRNMRTMSCNVPAAVTAIHPLFDAALVRPTEHEIFFPEILWTDMEPAKKTQIQIHGFPVILDPIKNSGDSTIFDAILRWLKHGGVLKIQNDTVEITRGKIKKIGVRQKSGAKFFLASARSEPGISGGGVFDRSRNFIGIPTMRNQAGETMILDFSQLVDWIFQNQNLKPIIARAPQKFYETRLRKPKIIANRKRKIHRKVNSHQRKLDKFKKIAPKITPSSRRLAKRRMRFSGSPPIISSRITKARRKRTSLQQTHFRSQR